MWLQSNGGWAGIFQRLLILAICLTPGHLAGWRELLGANQDLTSLQAALHMASSGFFRVVWVLTLAASFPQNACSKRQEVEASRFSRLQAQKLAHYHFLGILMVKAVPQPTGIQGKIKPLSRRDF